MAVPVPEERLHTGFTYVLRKRPVMITASSTVIYFVAPVTTTMLIILELCRRPQKWEGVRITYLTHTVSAMELPGRLCGFLSA